MIKKSRVVVQVIYVVNGVTRTSYGEIDESKLDGLHAGEGSFISLLNDGKITWFDKEAILSVYELETKFSVDEKHGTEEASLAKII